jgi:hypothetical protein
MPSNRAPFSIVRERRTLNLLSLLSTRDTLGIDILSEKSSSSSKSHLGYFSLWELTGVRVGVGLL